MLLSLAPRRLDRPIFIVGCGRSGTTILGRVLARHPQLAFLNGPLQIWLHEPRTDVWSLQARKRKGRLVLSGCDTNERVRTLITRDFAMEVAAQRATRLVEKLPINSFRIGFIDNMFSDAIFLHLIRNGLEVARSIAQLAKRAPWFGEDDYKWELLTAYACAVNEASVVQLCTDNFLRGLMEWRLTVTAAQASLRTLPTERVMEIRYEELLADPVATLKTIEEFIGVASNIHVHEFACQSLVRKSPPIGSYRLSAAESAIGGELLDQLGYGSDHAI